jgi:hypothetical protein
MFLGHYAAGLAAKRLAPRTSLGATLFAAQLLDQIWPVLLLAGVERVRIVPGLMAASPFDFEHYPISHSLAMALVWGAVLGGLYFVLRRDARGAWVVGALVVSHWFLDLPMHRPDLPLWPGSDVKLGLGLWNSVPLTLLVELGLFAAGVAVYLRTTRARDRVGSWGLYALLALLLLIFLGSATGTPPPSVRVLALTSVNLWLFALWGFWVDRHREPLPLPAGG